MSESTSAFAAMVAAFGELQNPPKTSKVNAGQKSYWFAPLPEILDAVRPILLKHGLAVRFQTAPDAGNVLVSCEVVHNSGVVVAQAALHSPGGANMQTVGSGLTYARRYTLTAALGIAADDDDDGEATTRPAAAKAPPQPVEAPPSKAEALAYLASVLDRCKLTSGQVNSWRGKQNKSPLDTLTPEQMRDFANWLAGRGADFWAQVRG